MRRILAVLVTALAVAVLAGLAPPASAATTTTYVAPVEGTVTDGFRPPKSAYGTGNRGLTYATPANSPARAAAPGRVTFAGQVGGALHVVVQHPDGVRTSYSFLRTLTTRTGATLRQGDTLGTTASSFHFGARIGDAYVDPAILLDSGPARVHLVPDGEFKETGADDDRFSLATVARDFASVSRAAVEWAGGLAAEAAADAVAVFDIAAEAAAREMAEHLITFLDAIVEMGQLPPPISPITAFAAALADTLQAFIEDCTSPDVATPVVAERRIAVFVAGLGSSSAGPDDKNLLSKRFHASEVYADGHTYDFSYRGGRNPAAYSARDTVGDLHERASDLRDLLDQISRDHPGVPVDVIAHSQGGLIAREAFAHDYDGPTHVMPNVKHFVTLGTPHHGADIATLGEFLRWTEEGAALLKAGNVKAPFDLNGKSLSQLAETSSFIRRLGERNLPEGVAFTSIGAAKDLVVPAVRARVAGASNVLVDVSTNPTGSHTALTKNAVARRELALALNDQPPTCQPLATTAARAATSASIANFEDGAGGLAGTFSPAP